MYDFGYWSLLPALLDGRLSEEVSLLIKNCQDSEAFVEFYRESKQVYSDAYLEELLKQLSYEKLKLLEYTCHFVKTKLSSAKLALQTAKQSATQERLRKLKAICDGLIQQCAKDLLTTLPEEAVLLESLREDVLEVAQIMIDL